jgi:hypothetical protein
VADFTFDAVDQLVSDLKLAGTRDASVDPADLVLPGVLVQPTAIVGDLFGGHTIRIRCALVAQAVAPSRAMPELAALFAAVAAQVGLTGDATLTTMVMPDGVAYPCILYPVELFTEPAHTSVGAG